MNKRLVLFFFILTVLISWGVGVLTARYWLDISGPTIPLATSPPVPAILPSPLPATLYCDAIFETVCHSSFKKDPTGKVLRSLEGQVWVLRTLERLLRKYPNHTPDEIDEKLAQEIYTPSKRKTLIKLFEKIKSEMLRFLITTKEIDADSFEILRQRILLIQLELPPPASIYADDPDLLTLDNAFFETASNGQFKIRIGGAMFYGATSQFNLVFTLAHELAHGIEPCDFLDNPKIQAYSKKVMECISPLQVKDFCARDSTATETFADWIATHVVAEILEQETRHFSAEETQTAVFNSVIDLCPEDPDSEAEIKPVWDSLHPSSFYRINGIFARHPKIQKLLGCVEREKGFQKGIHTQCYSNERRIR